MFWRTTTKLATERNIGDFRLPETDDLSPTNYVLDGQQRLTVIYSCFGAYDDEDGFKVGYNLIEEEFVKLSNESQIHIFPLEWIYNTTKLLNFRTGLLTHTLSEKLQLQSRLDALIEVITNYRLPVVILKDLSVEEVCPIFERINSSGTRLSTYDLMVAATWTEKFNLDDEVESIAFSLKHKNFEDITGDTILKCMSAVKHKSIKKQYVLDLRKLDRQEMDGLVLKIKDALLKTVDLLTTEFKIYSWDFLPYEAIVVIICYIYYNKKQLQPDDIIRLRKWFWTSSFSGRYRDASDSFISKDLECIEKYILQEDVPGLFNNIPTNSEIKNTLFRSNNSQTRAFILMLALCSPRNITNGTLIDVQEALSIYNKKQYHHIYPQAYLKGLKVHSNVINSISNRCMLAASENNFISDRNPNEYIPELIDVLGNEYEKVFRSNLLPVLSKEEYKQLSYESFIDLRSKEIEQHIKILCEGNVFD